MAHGGDRYRNRVEYDFSVNVNQLGMPRVLQDAIQSAAGSAAFYPDPEQEASRRAAAAFYGERAGLRLSPEWMIPGNGASELIMAVIHALHPRKVLLPAPVFTGYLRAICGIRDEGSGRGTEEGTVADSGTDKVQINEYPAAWEHGFQPDAEFADRITPDTDLVILVNPGNPGGSMIAPGVLRALLQKTAAYGIPVLLDECFLEFTGKEAESGLHLQEKYSNLLVLRAFTKIFAMPGVRLGCLICREKELGKQIRAALPEWNLSCFAEAVLAAAGEHRKVLYDFLDETAWETARLRERMKEGLCHTGRRFGRTIEICPSEANFLLTDGWGIPGRRLFDALLAKGILVRCCGDMPPLADDRIRISVRPEAEQDRLFGAFAEIMSGQDTE